MDGEELPGHQQLLAKRFDELFCVLQLGTPHIVIKLILLTNAINQAITKPKILHIWFYTWKRNRNQVTGWSSENNATIKCKQHTKNLNIKKEIHIFKLVAFFSFIFFKCTLRQKYSCIKILEILQQLINRSISYITPQHVDNVLFVKTSLFPTRSFKRHFWNMHFGFVKRSQEQLQELLVLRC